MPANRSNLSTSSSKIKGSPAADSPPVKRPYAKANRSLRACDACHSRKTRCSGEIPCTYCLSKNLLCKMSDNSVRSQTSPLPNLVDRLLGTGPVQPVNLFGPQSAPGYSSSSSISSKSTPHHPSSAVSSSPFYTSKSPPYSNSRNTAALLPSINTYDPLGVGTGGMRGAGTGYAAFNATSDHTALSSSSHSHSHNNSPPPLSGTSSTSFEKRKILFPELLSTSTMSVNRAATAAHAHAHTQAGNGYGMGHHVTSESGAGDASNRARVAPLSNSNQEADHSVSGMAVTRFQRPTRNPHEADLGLLLDRGRSARYFELYFSEAEFIYQLWPIPSIIQRCHCAIWSDGIDREDSAGKEECSDVTVPGMRSTLLALLALGAFFDRNLEDSEMLYFAARSSFLEIADLATMTSVQLALQLAVFEINTSRSKSLWSSLAVAVRVGHSLNLHRKPALAGRSPEECLRRSQLWWNCFVHDCWLSLTSGRPTLANEGDCDLDGPWMPSEPGQAPGTASALFGMRVRLSHILCDIHARLYRQKSLISGDIPWLQSLPQLEADLQTWYRDIHQVYKALTPSSNDKKHFQVIIFAWAVIRLIMHRSFLIRPLLPGMRPDGIQRGVSEIAMLEAALDIVEAGQTLIDYGLHLSFWFLGCNLQIACLGLCEYLQNKIKTLSAADLIRPEQGIKSAIRLLEHIAHSGDNPSMVGILEAVRMLHRSIEPGTSSNTPSQIYSSSHGDHSYPFDQPVYTSTQANCYTSQLFGHPGNIESSGSQNTSSCPPTQWTAGVLSNNVFDQLSTDALSF